MDPSAPEDDQGLLDRLNALRQSSISLAKASSIPQPPVHPSSGEPLSKEDALTARLRVLRNRPQGDSTAAGRVVVPSASTGSPPAQPQTHAGKSPSAAQQDPRAYQIPPDPSRDEVDPLPAADDQALDELLEGLKFDPDVDELGDEELAPAFDPGDEAKKVAALLDELQKTSTPSKVSDRGVDGSRGSKQSPDDDDDSDGDEMNREVEDILARVRALEGEFALPTAPSHKPHIE